MLSWFDFNTAGTIFDWSFFAPCFTLVIVGSAILLNWMEDRADDT